MKPRFFSTLAVVLLGITSINAQQPKADKPPLGIPADATLFNGKWYKVFLEEVTWKRAQEKCRGLSGQLVVIHDETTQAFIAELGNTLELWIGATDGEVEGQWIWSDGTPMKFKAWGPGQPRRNDRSENYLGIGGDRRWFDAPNDWPCVGYICEWPAE